MHLEIQERETVDAFWSRKEGRSEGNEGFPGGAGGK